MEAIHSALENSGPWNERTRTFLGAFERFYKYYQDFMGKES